MNLINGLGISVAANNNAIGIIGTTVTNQSVSLGVSYGGIITTGISQLNLIIGLGYVLSNLETNKADKLQVSTSASKYLQRNEIVLPNTFTKFATTDNIMIESSAANSYLQFKELKLLITQCAYNWIMVGRNLEFRSTNDDFIFRAQGGLTEKFRISQAGNGTFTDNLTVSGVLQSPITSLLGVSSSSTRI